MTSFDLTNAINRQLDALRSGALSIWGTPFADNVLRIAGADVLERNTVIYFNLAESLIVEAPRDWSLAGGRLLIREAKRIRLQWFHYGRLPSRDTLRFEEYRPSGNGLAFESDFQPQRSRDLDRNAPAVQFG